MPLTKENIETIIRELGVPNRFLRDYEDNAKWFVNRMIKYYTKAHPAEGYEAIYNRIDRLITDCRSIAKNKQDFTIGIVEEYRRTNLKYRVEIIYGALAAKPELTDPVHNNFLDFIIKRRYRSILRVNHFVNPNYLGYFWYPAYCNPNAQYQVNEEAELYWSIFDATEDQYFMLNPDLPPDPVTSIEKLFLSKLPCTGNLFDCSRAASVVLMDQLLEAYDKNKLLMHLALKPPTEVGNPLKKHAYLSISNPSDIEAKHFCTDPANKSLFKQADIDVTDLQVGDHIYISNHPLYKIFHPYGIWRGEHAFVCSTVNEDNKGFYKFKAAGHGMEERDIREFYSEFIKELKTDIEWVHWIVKIHLAFRHPLNIQIGIYNTEIGSIKVKRTSDNLVTLFEYNTPFTYLDYTKKGKGKKGGGRFVISQSTQESESDRFKISKAATIEQAITSDAEELITISRKSPTSPATTHPDNYALELYFIEFHDKSGQSYRHTLFDPKGSLNQLTMTDLLKFPFDEYPKYGQLISTQPKVDLSASYQSFLKTYGAIN